jgi:hypothetical protein
MIMQRELALELAGRVVIARLEQWQMELLHRIVIDPAFDPLKYQILWFMRMVDDIRYYFNHFMLAERRLFD